MPGVTLFDVAHLFETDSPPPCAAGAPPASEPPAPESPERRTRTSDEPRTAPARDDASVTTAAPEVEVRISKRRKKTSEAKWVGGRIVVSLPAHLNAESRQKTVDWLVERLLTRHQLQSGLDDDGLLARAIELSDRYLVGARPAFRPLGHQPDGALGLVLVLLGPDPPVPPPACRARVGARLGTGARTRPSDPSRPLRAPSTSWPARTRATRRRACSWPATAWASRTHPAERSGLSDRRRGGRRPRQTGSSAKIRPSRRRLSFAPPSVSSICSVRRKYRCSG